MTSNRSINLEMSFCWLQFFKKPNKNNSTWGIIVVRLIFFVHFLEELRIPKSPFEINWALTDVFKICWTFWTNIGFFLFVVGPDVIWYICPCYSVTTIEVKSWYCGPRQRGSFFHENLSNATKSVFGNFCPVFWEFFTWSLKNAYIVKSLKCIPCTFCHRLALDSNGLKTFLKVDKSHFFFFPFSKND